MSDIPATLAREFDLHQRSIDRVLSLVDDGATVPFLARYRKEQTGGLDEAKLRDLLERHTYLNELEERKQTIIRSIDEQGKLTGELRQAIESCRQKTELEDLYLPYKPKRRTRATIARERGLEPLADRLRSLNRPDAPHVDLALEAQPFVNSDQGIDTTDDALLGASDILAESVAEDAELRAKVRQRLWETGQVVTKVKRGHPKGTTNYEMYRGFKAPVRSIAPHQYLAVLRGEVEDVLSIDIEGDDGRMLADLEAAVLHAGSSELQRFYREMLRDALDRLMVPSLTTQLRQETKRRADLASVQVFASNLYDRLMAPPAGPKSTLGVDPGFRTGCKLAAVDPTGKFLHHATIYPHGSDEARHEAGHALRAVIRDCDIDIVALGDGTASRETESFLKAALQHDAPQLPIVMVSEAGASVYSASDVARAEFPDLDVTVRGAISIARRLQDPLAELVKLDPEAIGVGQYQHDVDGKLMRQKLAETVETCVNAVGVDVNTASQELLQHVSGLNASVAGEIVSYRDEHGPFAHRQQLLNVPKLGPKTFEQAAGFLRIRDGDNPLDNTAVHPERYELVAQMASDLGVTVPELIENPDPLEVIDRHRYAGEGVGEPTLRDIVDELNRPGRDPRDQFEYARFREDVQAMDDLELNMVLEGVVTNVTDFGAFVDVGVHQDGLVHISKLADRFVRDPRDVVRVGDVVQVRVVDVDVDRGRFGLSMRSDA
ncbi:MAG: Tex family protein [Candidatus Bipolaricaulia bacterium]